MLNLDNVVSTRKGGDYQRDNFDAFLKKIKFSYKTPSIHVAGTNGKGSTCYYLDAIYRNNGYKVGRFISPALVNINECIAINGCNISDEEIISLINEDSKLIKKYDLSSFELLTYIAFKYFDKNKCDIAIIECGMGGEIDATNIFVPVASVITSISLEHTELLGKTLSEVALHKSGIIKNDTPLIVGELDNEASRIIYKVANEVDAPIHLVVSSNKEVEAFDNVIVFAYQNYKGIELNSSIYYERMNVFYALETVNVLMNKFPVEESKIKEAIKQLSIPCRFEVLSEHPLIIVDGGHNPEAMALLARTTLVKAKGKQITTIFASFTDKNLMTMLNEIGKISEELLLTTFEHPRSRKREDYFLFADEYLFFDNPKDALRKAVEEKPDNLILITGSLAFASYMKEIIKNEKI